MAGEVSTHSSEDDTHFPRSSLSSSERPDSEEDIDILFKMVYECAYTVYKILHFYSMLWLLFLPLVTAEQMSGSGTTVDILGQSGKVTINDEITMQVDAVYEMRGDAKVVKFETMANQNFQFSPLKTTTYQNISVQELYFFTPLQLPQANSETGFFDVRTMLIGGSGTLSTDTEQWSVSPGDMKWNIELRNWNFDPLSTGVEVHMEIKGNKEVGNSTSKTLDLGAGTLQLSNRVKVDGAEVDMSVDIVKKGSKDIYMFKFPKFTNTLIYDPVLQLTSSGSRLTCSLLIFLVLLI